MEKKQLQVIIKTFNISVLKLYIHFLEKVLRSLNIRFSIFYLPIKKKRFTLLK
jgi:hypothetical protein